MFCSGRGVLEEESKKWVGWVRGLEEGKGLVWGGGGEDRRFFDRPGRCP